MKLIVRFTAVITILSLATVIASANYMTIEGGAVEVKADDVVRSN